MASGKYDPGYSFQSDRSDTWKQRQGRGRAAAPPVLVTAEPPAPGPAEPAPSRPCPARRIEAASPDPRACPGECNRRYHDAWKQYTADAEDYNETGLLDSSRSRPEPPEEAFWYGGPVWCPECAARIGLRLAQLDILAGILAASADGHRQAADVERVSTSPEPPSPSQAGDDLDEMHAMLSNWEAIYRALKGWSSGPPRGELASRETECINWLQRHLRGILSSDIAADFGREVLQWHRESAGAAKAGARTLRKPMRCPGCKHITLFWTEGDKQVYCKDDSCGRILSLAEYEAEAEEQARRLQRGEYEDAELEAS